MDQLVKAKAVLCSLHTLREELGGRERQLDHLGERQGVKGSPG